MSNTVPASVHVGPFVGSVTVVPDATIGKVVVRLGSDASIHLLPEDARRLAAALDKAADEFVVQVDAIDAAMIALGGGDADA